MVFNIFCYIILLYTADGLPISLLLLIFSLVGVLKSLSFFFFFKCRKLSGNLLLNCQCKLWKENSKKIK